MSADQPHRPVRLKWIILAAALSLSVVAALNWQAVMMALAVTSNETRPALLRDAEWGKPESARQFGRRFAPGTPEDALIEWLQENGFVVNRLDKRAERRIEGMPCNERVEVSWAVNAKGTLELASAKVTEAGCL